MTQAHERPGGAVPDGWLENLLSRVSARGSRLALDTTPLAIAQYSYDASNYRVPPLAVAFPRDERELAALVASVADVGVPVVARGAGTSMAGNAIGPGVVVDLSRSMRRVIEVRPDQRLMIVQAGARLADVQTAAIEHNLMFAPDPSSGSRVTIGGMLGNDACGNHSVAYGRTSDHVVAVRGVLADGSVFEATGHGIEVLDSAVASTSVSELLGVSAELRDVVSSTLGAVRTELGRIPRQVSGYHLHRLLPENGFDVAKFLVGSEGTLAILTEVTLRLVPRPTSSNLVVIGYPDLETAARDVPLILRHGPSAIEAMDQEIVAAVRDHRLLDRVGQLPEGRSWLYVEMASGEPYSGPAGVDVHPPVELSARIDHLLTALSASGRSSGAQLVDSDDRRAALWRMREDGTGLIANPVGGPRSVPGWEDAAVAPDRLAEYVRGFKDLCAQHGVRGVLYGHFGAGCVHTRIDFDLASDEGRAAMRSFVQDAADLVADLGGSVSGEHGDGRSRSELLPRMYSPEILQAFSRVKMIFDPQGVLNPGIIVDPASLTEDLLPVPAEAHDFGGAALHAARCVGVGRCVVTGGTGGMCPSYRATGLERDSTRGRARALLELSADPPIDPRSVLDTLDDCLSCKACATDCPTGVDIATAKAEFLHQHYRRRVRPLAHYTLNWLPTLAKLGQPFASIVNAALDRPRLRRTAARLAGATEHRRIPHLAQRRVTRSAVSALADESREADVLLFIDTFTRRFEPQVLADALEVLTAAGVTVAPAPEGCCAVPWISSGQLGVARRVLGRTVRALDSTGDLPILVLEPSCAAALVDEPPRLLDHDASRRVAARIVTFEQALARLAPDWTWPALPRTGLVQQHCHERSVLGDGALPRLRAAGMMEASAPAGCCGMAGTFGFERDHYEMSMSIAALDLEPALERLQTGAPVVADGFGCRQQLSHLGASPQHTAQLLAGALREAPRPAG